MTLYALKQLPDNLSAVLDTLDKELANVTDFNEILQYSGWLLRLDEDQIPEPTLTLIQMMITGYATRVDLNFIDPAAALGFDINRMYPYVVNTTMKIKMIKDRDGIRPGDTISTYAYGSGVGGSLISDTVPDLTQDRHGEDSGYIQKSVKSQSDQKS